ncbi:unnamed protein product [Bursaphelenchus xylophilus]|uniref:Aldehyde dehydrogenase n=1 Tax=Bursaphelenchus xylophilus TaxID=6326 RepID=A0A811LSL7_BURXY|nr:unnamed protein product [Bursaphelenchus xylophilus]CAG9122009.1 unnamed protein product [Bursaphelenchus xylophilus]
MGSFSEFEESHFESKTQELYFSGCIISTALSNLDSWMAPQKVSRSILQATDSTYIHSEPLGVVLIVGTWNFPVQLLLSPLIGALAAGNTILIKPSEMAAATEKLFVELFPKYFDERVIKVVTGGKEEMGEILKLRFDHIFFTGSTSVGRIVMKAAAENLTPVTLELGGKSPVIIDTDADLRTTAKRVTWGKLINNGQVCVTPDYVLLIGDSERRKEFTDECVKCVKELYGEDAQKSPDYGRIINESNFDRLSKIIDGTNGKILYGGRRDRSDKFIEPTIISVEPHDITLADELFGPILPVLTVPTLDDAIKYIRGREKPLVCYLFSNNKKTVEKVKQKTSSGTLTINDVIMHMTVETLPFGGVGHSGTGRYQGKTTFDTFSNKKSVYHRTSWFEWLLWMRYPPFTADKLKWMCRLILSSKIRLPF